MSEVVEQAVNALSEKMKGVTFDGSAKFLIKNEGSIVIDTDGVRASEDETEVTLIATAETFQNIMNGELDATSAFMSGNLQIEGDMSTAMRLNGIL